MRMGRQKMSSQIIKGAGAAAEITPTSFFVLMLSLGHINQTFLIFSILFLLFTTPHLIFLHSGIVHQSNIVVDIKAEKRT